jgi:MFS family permease
VTTTPAARHPAQRRVLAVLTVAQVPGGVGPAAGVTAGALLAHDMLGSPSGAGLLSALGTAGSALAAVAIGRLTHVRGRRPGLVAGYLAGAAGSAGVVAAAVLGSTLLLCAAMVVYGAGAAANLQARYAGADLAAPGHRARAVSTVLVATTVGAVAGPALVAPAGEAAHALGVPRLAGLFLLSGAGYAVAAVVLACRLRPDPLLAARALEPAPAPAPPGGRAGPPSGGSRTGVAVGALVMTVTQFVMVAVMTMTPVHLHAHGHGDAASGLVIAVHVGAMYLPAPLSGRLVDRYGPLAAAATAALVLASAGLLAALAPGGSAAVLAAALGLLGLGWSLGLVSGTALVTDAVPVASRARTQGRADVLVAVAGATGGLASGVVTSTAGYPALAAGSAVLAAAVVPVVALAARGRRAPLPERAVR